LAIALASGAVLGVGGRLVMRLVALEAGLNAAFSLGGSIDVVMFGVLLGAPITLVFCWLRARMPVGVPWGGVIVGGAVFVVLSVVPPPAARSAMAGTADTGWVTGVMFAGLFVGWMVGVDAVWGRWGRRRGRLVTL